MKCMLVRCGVVGLLFAATVLGESFSSPRIETSGGLNELVVEGVPTIRATAAEIHNARLIEVSESPALVVVWEEVSPGGDLSPFYAVSLDGRTVSAARETSYAIHLTSGSFDPAERSPAVAPELRADDATSLYIVQFVTQPLEVFRSRIRALGGSVYGFLANHAHVVRMDREVRDRVEALPYVRWVGSFHPAYRVEAYLRDGLTGVGAPLATMRYHIRVAKRGALLKDSVADRIRALGGTIDANYPEGFLLQATLTPEQLRRVIRWDEVLFVDRWSAPEDDMDIARELSGANLVETIEGFTGHGVRAEVMDGNVNEDHPDLVGGIILHGGKSGSANHGTSTSGVNFGSGAGNPAARGMVPEARGIFASYNALTNRHTHTAALAEGPYFAVYQSNSWGDARTTEYTNISSDFDDILFQNDILVCQSQSNAGNQESRPQAWAKNVVSVGGVYHRNNLSPSDDFWDDASIGPAADGRIKPDLVHFYDQIFTTTGTGYTNFCCTSGATPIVAGHFGVFFEMWHEGVFGNPVSGSAFHSRPHAATSKAMMINAAFRYPFNGLNHNMTRTHQGWGMPSIEGLYNLRERMFIVDETDVLTNLASTTYTLTVPSDAPELRATLVYNDPPGAPFAAVHRINDLTLRVVSPDGTFYYGNDGLLESNASTPNGGPNTIDTVENVLVGNPMPGEWTFEVRADEINEDSHLETSAIDADFALVISGVLPPRAPRSYFDANADGDVDLADFEQFDLCFTGPTGSADFTPIAEGCDAADCDGDADIDLADYACFARSFSGGCGLRIITQPDDQAACVGGAASFAVETEGEGLSYQWYRGANAINGATQSTFSLQPVSNASAGDYYVLISGDCAIDESIPATLAVSQPPEITAHPESVASCYGESASFSVAAAGVGALTYQWHFENAPIPGATQATHTIDSVAPEHLGAYQCAVRDDCDVPIMSGAAQLTTTSTEFTVHPTSGDVCDGGTIFLLASATGLPTYQWFKDGDPIDGASGAFLVVSNAGASDAGVYHAEASGMCNAATSNEAVITIIGCGAP